MKVAVVANPVSGPAWRRRQEDEIERRVRAMLDLHRTDGSVTFTAEPGHATRLARAAVDGGADVVIAWGGDGTVNEVASALVDRRAALGIVPVGSGNGLALELGIPRRPDEALAVALGGVDRLIDVGDLNGRLFFNCAGVGFDARVAEAFAASASRVRGLVSYAAIGFREFVRYEAGAYRIEAEGEAAADVRALLISVANTRQWGNGALIAPGAIMDDDRLDVVVIPPHRFPAMLANIWRLFAGSIAARKGVTTRQVRAATITATPPAPVHVDGEPLGRLSVIRIQVLRAALRVRVPASR
jgi:YegS/Rv2252/BmrU family lipid kinase